MIKRVAMMVACAALLTGGCAKDRTKTAGGAGTKYTCPMHPEVVQDKPGNCPKCGMKLVEKK